jgi:DNA-binding NarL/FixJ family response regulator
MLCIAIADDHEMVRTALAIMLKRENSFNIILETSSLADLFDKLEKNKCDILILDLNLEDSSGIATVKAVCNRYPEIKVLVLSAFPEEEFAQRAFDAGAKGYLHKSAQPNELYLAIKTLVGGNYYLNTRAKEILPLDIRLKKGAMTSSLSRLSRRELEVLRMVAMGLSGKQIAQKLGVSPKTVSTYRTRIVEKLGLHATSQLYRYALECRFHSTL